jgi:hypothetical protein
MSKKFNQLAIALHLVSNQFSDEAENAKNSLLNQISKIQLPSSEALIMYHDVLMFLSSHPSSATVHKLAENELTRISTFLKKENTGSHSKFLASGLPSTKILGQFSHDILYWLLNQKLVNIKFDSFGEAAADINNMLRLTLPSLERDVTDLAYNADELFKVLGVKDSYRLQFLIEQAQKYSDKPLIKDFLFDALQVFVEIYAKDKKFSRAYNRFLLAPVYFHSNLLKKFDSRILIDAPVPQAKILSEVDHNNLSTCIRFSLLLMSRETDPATYMDMQSLRLYELERGISIALYGMTAKRQLPSESYVGYTLFKNGFPAAYGGAWIYGRRALFGINIFEPFRGGESGYMMCQLLRVYRQVFSATYFEVEPYQFGKDNPEGITSGAFWFYYRYGFKPLNKKLNALSAREAAKIQKTKTYRSTTKTLLQFTESNIFLNLESKSTPPQASDINTKVRHMIKTKYQGNSIVAEKESVTWFLSKVGGMASLSTDESAVLKEVSLAAAALSIKSRQRFSLLKQMVRVKTRDLYAYQNLLLEFLGSK